MREMCTGKIRLLSQLGAEKIAFLYFYISALCNLIDRQNIYRLDAHIWEECAQKNRTLSQLGAQKIAKKNWRTYGLT